MTTTNTCPICGLTRQWANEFQAKGDKQGHARWHVLAEPTENDEYEPTEDPYAEDRDRERFL